MPPAVVFVVMVLIFIRCVSVYVCVCFYGRWWLSACVSARVDLPVRVSVAAVEEDEKRKKKQRNRIVNENQVVRAVR